MRKQIIWMIVISFVVGAIGSITFDRVFIPKLSNVRGLSKLRKLLTNSPIVITNQQRVEIDAGINTSDMIKQAQGYTVSIYSGQGDSLKYLGNGLILTADGVIFTSKNILSNISQVTVVANDGKTFPGLVRALDPKTDLAVVTIVGQNLTVAPFDDASKMQVSERLFALGKSTIEFTRQAVLGNLTSTVSNSDNPDQVLSTEAISETFGSSLLLTPDFIGGPIVNSKGQVMAMVVNGTGKIVTSEGLNQALSVYLNNGKIMRPYLGLSYQDFPKEIATLKQLPSAGVKVTAISADSPAKVAGLKAGDYIVAVDDALFTDASFERLVNRHAAGNLRLRFLRDGQEQTITFNLENR